MDFLKAALRRWKNLIRSLFSASPLLWTPHPYSKVPLRVPLLTKNFCHNRTSDLVHTSESTHFPPFSFRGLLTPPLIISSWNLPSQKALRPSWTFSLSRHTLFDPREMMNTNRFLVYPVRVEGEGGKKGCFDNEIWKVGEGGCVDIQRGRYPNSVWALTKGGI